MIKWQVVISNAEKKEKNITCSWAGFFAMKYSGNAILQSKVPNSTKLKKWTVNWFQTTQQVTVNEYFPNKGLLRGKLKKWFMNVILPSSKKHFEKTISTPFFLQLDQNVVTLPLSQFGA